MRGAVNVESPNGTHQTCAVGDNAEPFLSRTGSALDSSILEANNAAYEWALGQVLSGRRASGGASEGLIDRIVLAARSATVFHSGRFADGAIENILLQLGNEISSASPIPKLKNQSRLKDRRILHVLSGVAEVGGHGRMLLHWIRSDSASQHSVLITDQGLPRVPEWLPDAVRISGGEFICFPSTAGRIERACWLRAHAHNLADFVVLHHGAFDPIPTLAFALEDAPPVTILNHADHEFWLGSSVADAVINLRTAGALHTAERRFISENMVLPIPLRLEDNVKGKLEARRLLKVPDNMKVILSVARAEKFRPSGDFDFLETLGKILNQNPDSCALLVGATEEDLRSCLVSRPHSRIRFCGSVSDASLFRQAADVYIETFPFGSQTAALEAGLAGLPIVPAYSPLFPLLVTNDDSLLGLLENPTSEGEYITRANELLHDNDLRQLTGLRLKKSLMSDHLGVGWGDKLANLYNGIGSLKHQPKPIPETQCSRGMSDIALSHWRIMADGRTSSERRTGNWAAGRVRHAAVAFREVGNFAGARRSALRALRYEPFSSDSWRLLGVAALGRSASTLRRVLKKTT